ERVLALVLGQFRVHGVEADDGVVAGAPLQGAGQAQPLDLAGGADIARVTRDPGVGRGLVGGDVLRGGRRARQPGAAVLRVDAVAAPAAVAVLVGLRAGAGRGLVGQRVARGLRVVADRRAEAVGTVVVGVGLVGVAVVAVFPAHRVVAFLVHVAAAVGGRQQGAEAAVVPGVGHQAGDARVDLARQLAVTGLGAGRGAEAVEVERARTAQVHGRAQRTLVHLRRLGLVDLDLAEELGGEGVEVEAAAAVHAAGAGAGGGQRLQAVEADPGEVRTQAADGDALALAAFAVDRHAGDALHRFGQVLVGELADVLGVDRVDLLGRVALLVQRLLQALAIAGDGDRVELGRIGRSLLCGERRGQGKADGRGKHGNRCLSETDVRRHGSLPGHMQWWLGAVGAVVGNRMATRMTPIVKPKVAAPARPRIVRRNSACRQAGPGCTRCLGLPWTP